MHSVKTTDRQTATDRQTQHCSISATVSTVGKNELKLIFSNCTAFFKIIAMTMTFES